MTTCESDNWYGLYKEDSSVEGNNGVARKTTAGLKALVWYGQPSRAPSMTRRTHPTVLQESTFVPPIMQIIRGA